MVRIARERIVDLFALAEREAQGTHSKLADRYVRLARRIGMRYNLRFPPELREMYCRQCSTYWVEGRTVRTRLRRGRRVRTCLACGRERRSPWRRGTTSPAPAEWEPKSPVLREDEALTGPISEGEPEGPAEDQSEEP